MALTDPYRKPLTGQQAAHLLRRATFGPSPAQIRQFTGLTPQAAVTTLLTTPATPTPPVDPATLKPFNTLAFDTVQATAWQNATKYWWLGLMVNEGPSLREKMVVFWQNHFVSTFGVVADARYMYRQNTVLRSHAVGNFRAFVIDMTKDPAMLRYLNGNQNVVGKPNENYARELQELFTIGVGNYTEDDVKAAARVLTGWTDVGYRSTTSVDISTTFRSAQHDGTDKVFSAAYQNKVIKGRTGTTAGDTELGELVDMILAQPEASRFIVRKLYRWFINSTITADIEQNFIEPLALQFRQGGFEIKPVVTTMLTSQHFFDDALRGAIVKSPLELNVGTLRYFGIKAPDAVTNQSGFAQLMAFVQARNVEQQQNIMDQPTVFGWRPYYDTGFYDLWINSTTLALRGYFTDQLTAGTVKYGVDKLVLDLIALAKLTSDPSDPVKLIDEWSALFFAVDMTQSQRDFLIDNVLISGLPRYEWNLEWQTYMSDPTNKNKQMAVNTKLNTTLQYMFRLAEYQVC
ncbi:DUF1800 domain-containing protein [Fibrella forsythiae]|uniref:DUF1800 domain-containing protein n=1 Tax=Fibrella forsythiae TaxID=2817061 RepID=A0ABS3JES0_9BACT|nr:DUF1800 domain-containing protein [Fibrella forsythiae]MBO0947774.1 DUF1800 domain-containing protein [Fibrella forsythiae]